MAITGDSGHTENTGGEGELDPATARTPAAYIALLRRLKEQSGLTYRQLEQKAAERGDVLARSTLADVLRRDGLPRPEVVTALVRACGVGREGEAVWLEARERLAAGGGDGSADADLSIGGDSSADVDPFAGGDGAEGQHDGGDGEREGASGKRKGGASPTPRTTAVAAVASLGTVALLVVGALVLLPDGDGDASRDAGAGAKASGTSGPSMNAAATPVGPGPAPGLSLIRPARAPELCLTDGDVRVDSGESKLVAVQRPCAEAVPPRTYLLRADDGLYRIQWDNPQFGKGCLTLLVDGVFRNRLEPWNDCDAGGDSQLFRIERAEGTKGWRLRSALGDDMCVGIDGDAGERGAPAVVEGCDDREGSDGVAVGDRQLFLIGKG
ncbi:helix-turn-helix domain-containing protein [Streptomyces sp. NPDC002643]